MKSYCPKCSTHRKVKHFNKNKKARNGLQSWCRDCTIAQRRSISGKIKTIYQQQKTNSKIRNDVLPNYTQKQLITWCLSQPLYHKLHKAWIVSGYNKWAAPSCDRIDDYKPYTLDNLQLMTWKENSNKSYADTKEGRLNKRSTSVLQCTSDGVRLIKEHHSIRNAERLTGVHRVKIIDCCEGRKSTAGGYVWSY